MSVASNALIGVDYYRRFAGVADDSTDFPDEAIETLIDQASQMIELETNRKFITPASAITEIFDGNGSQQYYVKNGRIADTPTLSYWRGTSFTTTTNTFAYSENTGRVYFTDGSVFGKGKDNWQIAYKYGWTQATLPEDIKLVCASLVSHLRLMRMKLGISTESYGDTSVSYDWTGLPPMMQKIIDKYKVLPYG